MYWAAQEKLKFKQNENKKEGGQAGRPSFSVLGHISRIYMGVCRRVYLRRRGLLGKQEGDGS